MTGDVRDLLGQAGRVVSLLGSSRVKGVEVRALDNGKGSIWLDVPEPMDAEVVAQLLGATDGDVRDYAREDGSAWSAWTFVRDGVMVTVRSEGRPGALPAPKPRNWPVTADAPVPYELTGKAA